jgi:peptidyl-dipeptidase A
MSLAPLTVAGWLLASTLIFATTVLGADDDLDARGRQFVEQYDANLRPLEIEAARLFWTANITGKESDYQAKQAAEEKLDFALADPAQFAELKAIRAGGVSHLLLARQIAVLYRTYLPKQLDRQLLQKMLDRSNAVERAFNVFRPEVDGQQLTDNDVRRILRESRDSAQRRAAWEAGKKVGPVVVADLMKLVTLRNEAARKLGFKNYYDLQLYCGEQSQQQVLDLFDELDALTREPFHKAKAEIDAALARSYGIGVSELRPWHYHDPFFQEVPAVLGELPESVYEPLDPVEVCRAFYNGIGLRVDAVLKRSDLYERPGKNPHAFCIDIDRAGDVRVLENIVPGHEWLSTTLHEFGHAVYSINVGSTLPYVLHTDAHPLCTEGVAMMFERFTQNVDWLRAFGADVPEPEQFRKAAARLRRNRLLVFSRYCQVMFRFESQLYANPNQNLNKLWWDLVEKYQELKRPEGRDEPDFASKYHLIGAPAYYHNYMLGEMFASQVHHALVRAVLPGVKPAGAIYVGNKAAGKFMKQRVFQPGLSLNWNDLTRYATGQPLGPQAFAEDLQAAE